MTQPLTFAGQAFEARPSGALWWPALRWLIVADLHLGKSARMAARGGALLPPHDTQDTIDKLAAELAALPVARVVSLGDAFEDHAAPDALSVGDTARLAALAAGRDWVWITGNHDLRARPGFGTVTSEIHEKGLTLRHIAETGPDISGHYHPKARLAGRARPAFLVGGDHLILPAFGTYTGGLDCERAPLSTLIGPGLALLCGSKILSRPIGQPSQRRRA
ncbi:ligase-associated DNA damage response endonuclease PdeM [Pararhodobacter marinus]|uniref:ligase-associated DNA damage response endonuclease PdeM n=1 Tax=Pararhodobacter marinus TaxID=2184063 RepID=UPI003518B829